MTRRRHRPSPRKRSLATTFIANCPPERLPTLTAEDVRGATGLNLGEAARALEAYRARVAAARGMMG